MSARVAPWWEYLDEYELEISTHALKAYIQRLYSPHPPRFPSKVMVEMVKKSKFVQYSIDRPGRVEMSFANWVFILTLDDRKPNRVIVVTCWKEKSPNKDVGTGQKGKPKYRKQRARSERAWKRKNERWLN